MTDNFVIYNGRKVHRDWPAKIEEAQEQITYVINGKEYSRIRFGSEKEDLGFNLPCGDCAVMKGQYHVPNCDIERCPRCGGQSIGCDCEYEI